MAIDFKKMLLSFACLSLLVTIPEATASETGKEKSKGKESGKSYKKRSGKRIGKRIGSPSQVSGNEPTRPRAKNPLRKFPCGHSRQSLYMTPGQHPFFLRVCRIARKQSRRTGRVIISYP